MTFPTAIDAGVGLHLETLSAMWACPLCRERLLRWQLQSLGTRAALLPVRQDKLVRPCTLGTFPNAGVAPDDLAR